MLIHRGLKQENIPDKLLGFFLLFSAFYVVPWMTGFAGWYSSKNLPYRNFLFYMPFVHGLFMGPLLYFYVKAITNFRFQLSRRDWLHLLPGLLYLIWSMAVAIIDRLILKKYYLMDGISDPDFDSWYQWLQNLSILFYLIQAIRHYRQYRTYIDYELSFIEQASIIWLRNFLIAFALLTFLPLLEFILSLFPFFKNLNYVGSWYYFLSFALVVYYIAISGYHASSVPLRKLLFQPELLLQYRPPLSLPAPPLSDIEDVAYELVDTPQEADPNLKQWKEQLITIMQEQELYRDPELTLSQLAKKLSTNASVLSKVINQGFQLNFNDFVNQYRVSSVIELLKAGEQQTQTLLGISFDSGFNSKATFNRAFKKQTGLSPKEWCQRNL